MIETFEGRSVHNSRDYTQQIALLLKTVDHLSEKLESLTARKPKYPLAFVTDFSYAALDHTAPGELLDPLRRICKENSIDFVRPEREVHTVYPLNTVSGSFNIDVITRAYEYQPLILVGVVDPGVGSAREGIVIVTNNNHIYAGPNNGIFWESIKREGIKTVFKIKNEVFNSAQSVTFHGRDVFVPIAAEFICGKTPEQLTHLIESIDVNRLVQLDFQSNQILHLDGFNLVKVNARIPEPRPDFAKVTVFKNGKRKFIMIPLKEKFIDGIGQIMAYPGSTRGFMEIAVGNKVLSHEPNAVKQLSIDSKYPIEPGDILEIEWK